MDNQQTNTVDIQKKIQQIKDAVSSLGAVTVNNKIQDSSYLLTNNIKEVLNMTKDLTEKQLDEIEKSQHIIEVDITQSAKELFMLLFNAIKEFLNTEILSYTSLYHPNNSNKVFVFEQKFKEWTNFDLETLNDDTKKLIWKYTIAIFLLILKRFE